MVILQKNDLTCKMTCNFLCVRSIKKISMIILLLEFVGRNVKYHSFSLFCFRLVTSWIFIKIFIIAALLVNNNNNSRLLLVVVDCKEKLLLVYLKKQKNKGINSIMKANNKNCSFVSLDFSWVMLMFLFVLKSNIITSLLKQLIKNSWLNSI